jgi:hypothetical protein
MEEYDSYTQEVVAQGPCKKCCVEDELDADGICMTCRPLDIETVRFLERLIKTKETQEK